MTESSHAEIKLLFLFFYIGGGLSFSRVLSRSHEDAGMATNVCFREMDFEKILKGRMRRVVFYFKGDKKKVVE